MKNVSIVAMNIDKEIVVELNKYLSDKKINVEVKEDLSLSHGLDTHSIGEFLVQFHNLNIEVKDIFYLVTNLYLFLQKLKPKKPQSKKIMVQYKDEIEKMEIPDNLSNEEFKKYFEKFKNLKISSEESDKNYILLMQYIKNFDINFNLLLKRYDRFKKISNSNNFDQVDIDTYLDIIIVQLRALCIENKRYKENYTAQILLGKLGKKDLVEEIDNMLNENFRNILKFNPDGIEAEDISIRDAIKTLADEFICHYDNFDGAKVGNLSIYQVIFNQLRNPYEKVNLDYIMNILIKCIHKGFLSLYEGLHGNLNNNK